VLVDNNNNDDDNKAGVVAVPVFPPDPRAGATGSRKDVAMFAAIAATSGAAASLTNRAYDFAKKVQRAPSLCVSKCVAMPPHVYPCPHLPRRLGGVTSLWCSASNSFRPCGVHACDRWGGHSMVSRHNHVYPNR